jgi:fumarate reductase subunit D
VLTVDYVVSGVVLALVSLLVLVERRAVLAPIAAMIFLSALSPAQDYAGNSLVTWLFPLQEHRVEAASVVAVPILVRALAEIGGRAWPRVSGATAILILIAMYQGILRVFHQSLGEGIQTAVFGSMVVGSLAVCVPAVVREPGGLRRLLYCVAVANVAWLAGIGVQLVRDPEPLMLGSRFTGLTSNPQSAGIYLALSCVLVLWLALHERRGWGRCLAAVVVVADCALLLWTGSRTGVLSLVLGALLSVRGSSRGALTSAALLAVPTLVVLQLVPGAGAAAPVERLTSTADSGRIQALQRMLQAGLASPIVGNGIVDADASENSLLLGFAAFGLGMVALLLALIYASWRACRRLKARAAGTRTLRSLADAFLAFYAMCFFISLFEGILLARFRESLVLLVIINGAVAALLAAPRVAPSHHRTVAARPSRGPHLRGRRHAVAG